MPVVAAIAESFLFFFVLMGDDDDVVERKKTDFLIGRRPEFVGTVVRRGFIMDLYCPVISNSAARSIL